MTCNYSFCRYTPEIAKHVKRGELLFLQRCCVVWRGCYQNQLVCVPSGIRILAVSVQTLWKFNQQCVSKVTALTLWIQHALFIHVCSSTAIQLIFELLASWSFHLSIPSWQWKYDLPSHNSLELLLLNIYRMFTKVVCRQKKLNWHVALIHSTPTCVAAHLHSDWTISKLERVSCILL